jgi:WD40 repeat protein
MAVAINALVASPPDSQFIATGHEDGELELFGRAEIGARRPTLLNPDDLKEFRPIEALASSPDGSWLAVSRLKYPPPAPDTFPRTECEITIRRMPAGDEVRAVRIADDVVRAMAFSPDGRFLVTIGGEAQEVTVHDLRNDPIKQVTELRGPGSVLWDVGFIPDAAANPTVAFARKRPLGAEPTGWEGFDFSGRRSGSPTSSGARSRRSMAGRSSP